MPIRNRPVTTDEQEERDRLTEADRLLDRAGEIVTSGPVRLKSSTERSQVGEVQPVRADSEERPQPNEHDQMQEMLERLQSPTTAFKQQDRDIEELGRILDESNPPAHTGEEFDQLAQNSATPPQVEDAEAESQESLLDQLVPSYVDNASQKVWGSLEVALSTGSSVMTSLAAGLAATTASLGEAMNAPAHNQGGWRTRNRARAEGEALPEVIGYDPDPLGAHMSVFNAITERFTYQPQSESGREQMEAVFGTPERLLQQARDVTGDFSHSMAKRMGAGDQTAAAAGGALSTVPDVALMLLGGFMYRSAPRLRDAVRGENRRLDTPEEATLRTNRDADPERGPVRMRRGDREGEEVLSYDTPMPAGQMGGVINVKLSNLESLPGAKPHFRNADEARAFYEDLTSGRKRPEIVVETVEGLPTRVVRGAETVQAWRAMNERGYNIRNLKVRTMPFRPGKADARTPKQRRRVEEELGQIQRDSEAVNRAHARSTAELRELRDRARQSAGEKFAAAAWDRSFAVKQALNKEGEAGRLAVREHELMAGATARAHVRFQDARAEVYNGLGNRRKYDIGERDTETGKPVRLSEHDLFDRYLHSRRAVAIARSKSNKEGRSAGGFKFTDGTTAKQHANWLATVRDRVGDAKYSEFESRAVRFFEAHLEQLRRLRDEGLISQRDFTNMKDIEYMRREIINKIDPVMETHSVGGRTISVGESGIQHFQQGTKGGVRLDTENLMAEFIARTENRIARNRANKQLWRVAEDRPDNGVVRIAKTDRKGNPKPPPNGFENVRVRIDGKTRHMWMPENMAATWTSADSHISSSLANAMRISSGSALIRPQATGYNPGFALVNFPRDILHAWRATADQYNNFLPVYLGQMGRNLARTFKDAARKEGSYRDFIEEGGGMNFLTHQGREMFDLGTQRNLRRAMNPRLKRTKEALSALNEFSEIWVRLAIRDRHLMNQKKQGLTPDPREATWAARRYLDFSQGGNAVKAFDNFVPYLNASTQALRTTVREWKRRPGKAALRDFQLASAFMAQEMYNWMYHPETMEQIPEHKIRGEIIIPTGRSIVDEHGNRRYMYFQIKKEESVIPITAPFSILGQRLASGRPPTDHMLDYLTEVLPMTNSIMPSLQTYQQYVSNYDFWFDDAIWKGEENIEPYAEYSRNTSPLARDAGELLNMSPRRLEASVEDLTPPNTYTHIGATVYNKFIEDYLSDEEGQEVEHQSNEELLANSPFLRRVIKLTHPAAVSIDDALRSGRVPNTERELARRDVQRMLEDIDISDPQQVNNIRDAIRRIAEGGEGETARPHLAENLTRQAETYIQVDQILRRSEERVGRLPPAWWMVTAGQNAEARAEAFYDEWRDSSESERDLMMRIMGKLNATGTGYASDEFLYHFDRKKRTFGTDRPEGLIEGTTFDLRPRDLQPN